MDWGTALVDVDWGTAMDWETAVEGMQMTITAHTITAVKSLHKTCV